ncbi:MAG: GIY-YIG nuclease family protein [Flavobacteriales bacterium]|nr:GIY-YIG nuclease family protein [Flavobacteriales bacterium]
MYKVYFIQQKQKGRKGIQPVKIGYSLDPEARLKNLQTGSPVKLKLCKTIEVETKREAEIVERCLHRLGSKKHRRLEGEWFLIYGSWKAFIEAGLKMAKDPIKKSLEARA